jgi:signal transduction histidine kinase
MRSGSSSLRQNERRLLLGLAVMAAIILAQGVLGASVATHADAESRLTLTTSLESVREVSRIAHDVDEQRVLVNEHILEKDESTMSAVEARLADVTADIRRTSRRYAPLVRLPNERKLWVEVQTLQTRVERRIADVLALSRQNENTAARARLVEGQKDHMELDSKLVDLIQLNLGGASQTIERVRALQQRAEAVQWATRIAGLCALMLFGLWGTRRIVNYERRLTDYASEIEDRNRDLDAFAGRVAHDLRNALGPVVLSAPALKLSAHDPGQVDRIADRIGRCSDRALAVVDALLAFSRASHNAGTGECSELRAIVQSVEEELGPEVARLGVSLAIDEMPDLLLRCTPGLLHVVLANLCGNAVKYLEGRQEPRVQVSARKDGRFCRIEVVDTGPGIADEMRERIFEPFFRVEGTAARGTGIGLATVRRIVDARGGRVEVRSHLGRGSCFTVWLPLVEGKADVTLSLPAAHDDDRRDGSKDNRGERRYLS